MLINLENYYILSKMFSGTTLTITFQNRTNSLDRRVLELKDVAGFIDKSTNDELKLLRIDDEGNIYALDLSLQLKRPEIASFPEVLLFTDNQVSFNFRACAKAIHFREWVETNS